MIDNLFKLERLEPREVTFNVVAKTPEEKALAKIVNEKANEFLRKLIKYAEMEEKREMRVSDDVESRN